MMINSSDLKCKFSGDLVSYMYDELAAAERSTFERHLVDCTACTDEFAELADSRYSVYEWHKEEFVPLASPVISIPYRQDARVESRAGLFAGVRQLFALNRWPVAAAAMVTVVMGAGLASVFLLPGGEQQITANVQMDEAAPGSASQQRTSTSIVLPTPAAKADPEAVSRQPLRRAVRSVKGAAPVRSFPQKREAVAETLETPVSNIPVLPNATARYNGSDLPVLNSYEDTDDRSLRLADLIDDDGSRR